MLRLLAAALGVLLAVNAERCAAYSTWRTPSPVDAEAVTRPPARAPTAGERELLAVRINEVDQDGEVLAVRLSTLQLAVPLEALTRWRLRLPSTPRLQIDGIDHVALDDVPGLRWQIDGRTQTLVIGVPAAAFLRNQFEVVDAVRPAQSVADLGGYVNYDLHLQRDGATAGGAGQQLAAGLVEIGAFHAQGNGRTTGVWRRAMGSASFTRLDTTWNIDMPGALASVRLGDAIGTAGAWGRAVRFGGVQWATNFAVQPGLVSFPMPAVHGEANMPSIVDLYVNSTHQLQGKMPPGAFDLPDVPVVTGAGQIRMVVRDLLGREQVIVQPYYVSPALLRRGLHDFAVEGGAVREDYGLHSVRYGRPMLTATDRVGVSDTCTRELRVEWLGRQQTLGASGLWLVRRWATVNLSAAASRSDAGAGWLAAAGVDHHDEHWSAGMQARSSSRGFAQVGQGDAASRTSGVQTVRQMITANAALSVPEGGVGVGLVQQSTWQGDAYRSVSVNYGRHIGRLGYLTLYASRSSGTSSGTSVGINLIRTLDTTASASLSLYRQRQRAQQTQVDRRDSLQTVLQVQGAAPVGPGVGYQLQAERGDSDRASADVTWQTEHARFDAGVAHANSVNAVRAGATGAFVLMPEGLFASRRIDGSFAVVQVGDYEGVRVNRDNQEVGRTDARGRALVTGLRGFESNRISVEASDLPLEAQVDDLHVAVTPGMGSGVSVRFPVQRSRAVTLRLLLPDGSALPPGSSVYMDHGTREFPVGFDGKLFLAGTSAHFSLRADWGDQHCTADVDVAPSADAVPELGAVLCH